MRETKEQTLVESLVRDYLAQRAIRISATSHSIAPAPLKLDRPTRVRLSAGLAAQNLEAIAKSILDNDSHQQPVSPVRHPIPLSSAIQSSFEFQPAYRLFKSYLPEALAPTLERVREKGLAAYVEIAPAHVGLDGGIHDASLQATFGPRTMQIPQRRGWTEVIAHT